MTVDKALKEWYSKKRRMGCVSAAKWFSERVKGFTPHRVTRFTKNGESYDHVVTYNSKIVVDLTPQQNLPKNYMPIFDGPLHLIEVIK